jgi:hypothetical protein
MAELAVERIDQDWANQPAVQNVDPVICLIYIKKQYHLNSSDKLALSPV